MGFLSDLFSGGASQLVNTVGDTLDKITTTKEEKLQMELEMKKADMQYQTEMRKLSVEEKRMVLQDVDSARQMGAEVQTSANATKLSKNISAYLAIGTTLLTFFLFYLLIFRNDLIKEESKDVVVYILGVLSAIVTQIFSYYFGSSQGSADKNKMIADLNAKNKSL
jgi:hypothetical protein